MLPVLPPASAEMAALCMPQDQSLRKMHKLAIKQRALFGRSVRSAEQRNLIGVLAAMIAGASPAAPNGNSACVLPNLLHHLP
jgi:hypothetical protein